MPPHLTVYTHSDYRPKKEKAQLPPTNLAHTPLEDRDPLVPVHTRTPAEEWGTKRALDYFLRGLGWRTLTVDLKRYCCRTSLLCRIVYSWCRMWSQKPVVSSDLNRI